MPAPAPRVAALPPVNDDPAQLLGLDRDGVSALLGTPDLIRREAPAEIWQYVGGNCVFDVRSEEHTSELQSLMRNSYAVFCLKKKNQKYNSDRYNSTHENTTYIHDKSST